MPINWDTTKNILVNYFKGYVAQSEDNAATFITNQYEIAVLQGGDNAYKNMVTTYNKPVLENAIKSAMKIARTTNSNSSMAQLISTGLIGYWTGGQLALIIPPPGATVVVSNMVTNPGTPQPLLVTNGDKFETFVDNLITMFKTHMVSLAGITTALVPTPGGPVPTPFPWVGYS